MTACERCPSVEALSGPNAKESETMIEHLIMMSAMALLAMAKKKQTPVFGQLTLTGEKALDWMKSGTAVTVEKIHFADAALLDDEWNIPDWALGKGTVAILFPVESITEWANPVLVTQKSILRVLEAHCMEWEAAGCPVNVLQQAGSGATGQLVEIQFPENQPKMAFERPADAPTYAPYQVTIE